MHTHQARMQDSRIAFIGGGNMAGALIRGMLQSKTVTAEQIRASDVKEERLSELRATYGIETSDDNEAVTRWANVVVIAVKPQIVHRILGAVAAGLEADDLVISIAAGVPIESIEARLPATA